jgi:hypothetical protein
MIRNQTLFLFGMEGMGMALRGNEIDQATKFNKVLLKNRTFAISTGYIQVPMLYTRRQVPLL